MTKEDYLNRHIHHRLRLLTIFRKNFENETDKSIDEKKLSDFYVCSKDISIQMARSLLFELGLKLTKKDEIDCLSVNSSNDKDVLDRIEMFDIIKVTPDEIAKEGEIEEKMKIILKIANRAVSHIVEDEVDHILLRHSDTLKYLIPVINYIEKKVNSNIYKRTLN
jgi:hypothetical protein